MAADWDNAKFMTAWSDAVDRMAESISARAESYTLPEIREMLGLPKTTTYELIHRHGLPASMCRGTLVVGKDDFETWYANQTRFRKVNGEVPGSKVLSESFSVCEIATELGVSEWVVYRLMSTGSLPYTVIDRKRRVSKADYEAWLRSQSIYRTAEERRREEKIVGSTLSLPELAKRWNIHRNSVYTLLQRHPDEFDVVVIGRSKRVAIDSIRRWEDRHGKCR